MRYKDNALNNIGNNPTPSVLAIEIITPPTKLKYLVGEPLDLTEIMVNGYFPGGTTGNIPITEENTTGFDSSEPNENQTITVTVDDGSDEFEISIVEG